MTSTNRVVANALVSLEELLKKQGLSRAEFDKMMKEMKDKGASAVHYMRGKDGRLLFKADGTTIGNAVANADPWIGKTVKVKGVYWITMGTVRPDTKFKVVKENPKGGYDLQNLSGGANIYRVYPHMMVVANSVVDNAARVRNSKWVILYRDGGKEKIEAPSHAEAKKIAEAKSKASGRGYTSVIVDDGVDYGVNVRNAKFKAGDKAYVHWFSGEDELVDVISYEPKGDYYIVRGEDGQLAHPKASLLYPVKNSRACNSTNAIVRKALNAAALNYSPYAKGAWIHDDKGKNYTVVEEEHWGKDGKAVRLVTIRDEQTKQTKEVPTTELSYRFHIGEAESCKKCGNATLNFSPGDKVSIVDTDIRYGGDKGEVVRKDGFRYVVRLTSRSDKPEVYFQPNQLKAANAVAKNDKISPELRKHIPPKLLPHVTEAFKDSDGYWIWFDDNVDTKYDPCQPCGTIHEDTIGAVKSALRKCVIL